MTLNNIILVLIGILIGWQIPQPRWVKDIVDQLLGFGKK